MFYIQNHIFCKLDLPLPSSRLCARTVCVWTEKEFTYVHPAHEQDQKKKKKKYQTKKETDSSITASSANLLQQQPQHCCPSFKRSANISVWIQEDTPAHPSPFQNASLFTSTSNPSGMCIASLPTPQHSTTSHWPPKYPHLQCKRGHCTERRGGDTRVYDACFFDF